MTASASGPPAGIIPSIRYPSLQLRIGRGEGMLLYTDGVTEARNPRGELLGRKNLLRCLCMPAIDVQDCIHDLMERVCKFTRNEPQSDDITLLILVE